MECINKDAQYIVIDRGDAKILVDVADISALQFMGEGLDSLDKQKQVKIYIVQFTDGTGWQCIIDDETVERYNTLKGGVPDGTVHDDEK